MSETTRLKKTIDGWWSEIETFILTRATNARTEAREPADQEDQARRTRHNSFYKLARCTERRQVVADFYIALANTVVLVRPLLRAAWTSYRWDTRPRRRP